MVRYVLFGGTGFIGTHLSQVLLDSDPECSVTLVDINPPREAGYTSTLRHALQDGRARFFAHDVRKSISSQAIGDADVVVNLAAIHREPGHQPHEYFETNLGGADHICAYAAQVNAHTIVFMSSIAVYGATEEPKTEDSLTVPETPYGSSKLASEYIHRTWQSAAPLRKLLILRPGVVFGPGEGGNVTRLIRSLVKGYFVFMGNRLTRKAGGYVKELCQVVMFGLDHQRKTGEQVTVLNFTSMPTATLESFVDTVRQVAGVNRKPLTVPRSWIVSLSYVIHPIAKAFNINQPISPTRVRKLFRSTNIEAKRLLDLGYQCRYSLRSAFEDWKLIMPSDFNADNQPVASKISLPSPATTANSKFHPRFDS